MRWVPLATALFLPASMALTATFTVSNAGDSGTGTLRNAMLNAEASPGLDTIGFNIPGSGVHSINPLSPLPALAEPIVIDGTRQPGYIDRPLIEINGVSAGANSGFRLLGGNSIIRGLAINRFLADGIRIEGVGTNVVQANFIGTDASGAVQRGNVQEGISVINSWNNQIGGTNAGEGNLISGNGDAGVYLVYGGGNRVQGNRIGTSATGASSLGNKNNGIAIFNSVENIIGGESGLGRNVISGNLGSGIYLFGGGSKGNFVQGNFIGVDVTGKNCISNVADGITLYNASANLIGGTSSEQGNLLSGNGMAGLYLNGQGCSNNIVQGNLCGTDISGSAALGNTLAGIAVHRAVANLIGGTNAQTHNTISGNRESGILLSTNSFENEIVGNYIGVDVSGAKPLGNALNGISVQVASWNTISANVISGNAVYGCEISQGSLGNLLERNLIGTDATGQSAIGNSNSGVRVDSPFNTIGGAGADHGNVVSGNLRHGVFLVSSTARGNIVQGNFIGLDRSGTKALGNTYAGVVISSAPRNVIGTVTTSNCISGNGDAGIYLFGAASVGNSVVGNRIGTGASGKNSVANFLEGIYSFGANSNSFGGLRVREGNLISGNRTRGLLFTNSSWNVIQGNVIGATADELQVLRNNSHSVEFEVNSSNNTLGGTHEKANLIAFSPAPYAGVRVRDGSINNCIACNSIFGCGGQGIELGQVGIDPMDPCDDDSGANLRQNSPVLNYIVAGQGVAIHGTLNSRASTDYLIHFYTSPSNSLSGQGRFFLGQQIVHTDAQCRAEFAVTLPGVVPTGHFVTATATDPANNTSEFSPCSAAFPAPALSVSTKANQRLQLSWPSTAQGFVLKSTGSLTPPVAWQPVVAPPLLTNGYFWVTAPVGPTNQFYVLSYE